MSNIPEGFVEVEPTDDGKTRVKPGDFVLHPSGAPEAAVRRTQENCAFTKFSYALGWRLYRRPIIELKIPQLCSCKQHIIRVNEDPYAAHRAWETVALQGNRGEK